MPTAVQLYAKGNHTPKPLASKNTTRHAPATTPCLPAPTRRRTLPLQTPLGRQLAHSGCACRHTPSASRVGSAWRDALASGSPRLLGVAWRSRCGAVPEIVETAYRFAHLARRATAARSPICSTWRGAGWGCITPNANGRFSARTYRRCETWRRSTSRRGASKTPTRFDRSM